MSRVLQRFFSPFKVLHANQENIFTWLLITDIILTWGKEIFGLFRCKHEHEEEEEISPEETDDELETHLSLETREKWKADPPYSMAPLQGPAHYMFCAMQTECAPCKDREHCSILMRELQYEHAVLGKLPDIKYNFLIGGDGRVYEGRGWNIRPTLPQRYATLSDRSYFIGFIGDLTEKPTKLMTDARDLLMTHMLNDRKLNAKFLQFTITRSDQQNVSYPSQDAGY